MGTFCACELDWVKAMATWEPKTSALECAVLGAGHAGVEFLFHLPQRCYNFQTIQNSGTAIFKWWILVLFISLWWGGVSCNERGLLRILEAEKAKGMMNWMESINHKEAGEKLRMSQREREWKQSRLILYVTLSITNYSWNSDTNPLMRSSRSWSTYLPGNPVVLESRLLYPHAGQSQQSREAVGNDIM